MFPKPTRTVAFLAQNPPKKVQKRGGINCPRSILGLFLSGENPPSARCVVGVLSLPKPYEIQLHDVTLAFPPRRHHSVSLMTCEEQHIMDDHHHPIPNTPSSSQSCCTLLNLIHCRCRPPFAYAPSSPLSSEKWDKLSVRMAWSIASWNPRFFAPVVV